jgi:hypothetical protein
MIYYQIPVALGLITIGSMFSMHPEDCRQKEPPNDVNPAAPEILFLSASSPSVGNEAV